MAASTIAVVVDTGDAAMTTATEVPVTAMTTAATEEGVVTTTDRATLIAMLHATTAMNAVATTAVAEATTAAAVTTAGKTIVVDTVSLPRETSKVHVSDTIPREPRRRQALASVRERANSLRRETLLRARRASERPTKGWSCVDQSQH